MEALEMSWAASLSGHTSVSPSTGAELLAFQDSSRFLHPKGITAKERCMAHDHPGCSCDFVMGRSPFEVGPRTVVTRSSGPPGFRSF